MTIFISEEEKKSIIEDRLKGLSVAALSDKYSKKEIWIKRHLKIWLSEEQKNESKKASYNSLEYKNKQKMIQLEKENSRTLEFKEQRKSRLVQQSKEHSMKVQEGEFIWDLKEIKRRREHGRKIGNSEKHVEAMKQFAQERKKYFPEVIESHFSKLNLEYEADFSSSENYVIFKWPDGKSRKMQIKAAMLLDEIPVPCISAGEIEILNWIKSLGISASKYRDSVYEIDIFVPSCNIGIEYNGMYWHSEEQKDKNYHKNKSLHFKQKNIKILHIFENEWESRKEQIKNYLLSKLHQNKSVGARKIKWREVSIDSCKEFMETNHIQGFARSHYAIGGFLNDQLVICGSFGKHHRSNSGLVLNRFACKSGITISGGLSKISKIASDKFNCHIISWADLRFSDGTGYLHAGWKVEEVLPIDYFYWSRKKGVVSKQSRMKNKVNTPKNMTEYEHSRLDGLLRIWDCGKIRFIYKNN